MTLPPSSTSLLLPARNPACRAWLPQALYLAMPFCFSSAGIASHFVGSAWSNNRNCAISLSLLFLEHSLKIALYQGTAFRACGKTLVCEDSYHLDPAHFRSPRYVKPCVDQYSEQFCYSETHFTFS